MKQITKPKKSKSDLLIHMQTYLTKEDKCRLSEMYSQGMYEDIDDLINTFVDDFIARKEAKRQAQLQARQKNPRITPKKDRPACGAKCRSLGGRPCQAKPVWDKKHNKPVNGRCRLHGGLATGPKTPEGMKRVLQNLIWHRSNPQYEHNVKQLKARNKAIIEEVTLRGVHGQKCKLYRDLATKYNVSYATIRYVIAQSKKPSSNLSPFK